MFYNLCYCGSIVANGRSYVACGKGIAGLPVMDATKPNFIILFLHFCDKAKLENLALNVPAMSEHPKPPPAWYIGVVSNCRLLVV